MGALLGFWPALDLDFALWAAWSVGVSYWAVRNQGESAADDGWLTRIRPWERHGRVYEHLGVRRWKGRLPDLGRLFGGRRKSLDARRDPAAWGRLAAETRRAERAHWLILAAVPVEALLRTGVVLGPLVAVAVVANGPCIVAQRYNRGRLASLAERQRDRDRGRAVLGR